MLSKFSGDEPWVEAATIQSHTSTWGLVLIFHLWYDMLDSQDLVCSPQVVLRPTNRGDIPALFAMQCDPESNRLAGTKPRGRADFEARWDEILRVPQAPEVRVTPRAILADGVLVGSINIFPVDGSDAIGYWIDRGHWGRGIATRAVGLLIAEVSTRPLVAHVEVNNTASLRVLERHGFVVVDRQRKQETERYIGSEVFILRLGGDT
jgi:RimJ/RimL family protein N-acetyltransferase